MLTTAHALFPLILTRHACMNDRMLNRFFFFILTQLFSLQRAHLQKMKPNSRKGNVREREMDGDGERRGVRECVFHQSQPCQAIWAPISEA